MGPELAGIQISSYGVNDGDGVNVNDGAWQTEFFLLLESCFYVIIHRSESFKVKKNFEKNPMKPILSAYSRQVKKVLFNWKFAKKNYHIIAILFISV